MVLTVGDDHRGFSTCPGLVSPLAFHVEVLVTLVEVVEAMVMELVEERWYRD